MMTSRLHELIHTFTASYTWADHGWRLNMIAALEKARGVGK